MSDSTGQEVSGLLVFVALVAMVLLLPAILPWGSGGARSGLAPGQPAPPIDGEGWINGPAPAPADLSGRVLVVHAWASW